MKRTLHFTVEVAVEDDCDLGTPELASGIRQGIKQALASNAMLPTTMAASMIREVAVELSHSADEMGNCTPEVHRVLFCSTMHISEETDHRMLDHGEVGPIYSNVEAGYLIRVPLAEDFDDGLREEASWTADVQALLSRARAERCTYIRLDRDAGLLSDLRYYGR